MNNDKTQGGITNDKGSDIATTTSTVSAPTMQDDILAAAQQRMWTALDRKACPGVWMQIASDAVFGFKKDSYGEPLATPSSTEGAQKAPEEVRDAILKEAMEACEAERVEDVGPSDAAYNLATDHCIAAIRALRTSSTDQANADTGSAA